MSIGPIKILHVLFSLEPGGMENGVVNVARALPPDEFEVHVCCLERSGSFARRLPRPGHVHVLSKPPGFSLRAVAGLQAVIRRVRPHVIHSHNLGPLIYSGFASGFGCWRPVLHGEHTPLLAEDLLPRRRRQRAWLYRCCRRVHTVSEGLRRQLIGLGLPAGKITALVNGVDEQRFQPGDRAAARRQAGLPEKSLVLGIVGRFVPSKGHAVMIDAFSRLAPQRPDLHLLLVGSGGSEEERVLARARASAAAGRIHHAGHQENPAPYYQSMDLLVAPSTIEGMSNVVLEAMACGVPVLAHPAGGNAEVITPGRDGFIAGLDTAEKLSQQLERLLARPEQLPALGRAARETAVGRFSFPRMVQNYQQLYRSVAAPARP